jgi:hypothetical protein
MAFKFLLEEQDNDQYDPEYDTKAPSTARPPVLPQYIEIGVMQGRDFVLRNIRNMPADNGTEIFSTYAPNAGRIKEFLLDNSYVVTSTDKNLRNSGVA